MPTAEVTLPADTRRPGTARLVSRPALVERLLAASDARVVSVKAPAGYGKTTLLAEWAAEDPRPFAWVSVSHLDDQPGLIGRHIAHVLYRAAARAQAGAAEGVVLVLDDVHLLHGRESRDSVLDLVRRLPERSQLVFSGRSDGPPVARVRVEGGLYELGRTDLAIADSEARGVIAAAGIDVSEADARTLNRRAEGWAAGLQLLALGQRNERRRRVAEADTADRLVADYVRADHLSRLTPDEVDFLIRSAVLERLSGPLCDAVLGRRDSASLLESLERRSVFLIPLDRNGRWYRYHGLFREGLLQELERREPEAASAIHRSAAAWLERHGQAELAIEHAAAAGELDAAARLVGAHALELYGRGHVSTVNRWIATFEQQDVLDRHPAAAAIGAWVQMCNGRPDTARVLARQVERSSGRGPMPDGSATVAPWAAMVRALIARDGIVSMRAEPDAALAELPDASPWRGLALLWRGIAELLDGDLEPADASLAEAADVLAGEGFTFALALAQAERALLTLARGDVTRAEALAAEAHDLIEGRDEVDRITRAAVLMATVRLLPRRGREAEARVLLARAERVRPDLPAELPWFGAQFRIEIAHVHLALADVAGARILYRESQDLLRRYPGLRHLAAQAEALRGHLDAYADPSAVWASTLTTAELRLLPLMATHLSFREIAERLAISRNTVKTQAISVYRKLDASTRSEAIARARSLGLVDAPPPTAAV